MADISNISAVQHDNVDKQNFPIKTISTEIFDQLMLDQIAEQGIKENQVELSSDMDNDRHIDAFIQQAFSSAPETEKRIWAKMKEELGI